VPRRSLVALLTAEVVSSLGTLMTVVALPWFVLQTTGSPGRMGLVLAAETAPVALLGPLSGRIAGALGARRTLLACDALWVPAVALIPLLHMAGVLSFPLLVALAFLVGVPWAAHYGAQAALVPELLGERGADLARANAVFQTASRLTYFVGPALGGVLLALIGAPAVLLVDAATFAISFALVVAFVPPGATRGMVAEERRGGGMRLLRADRVLRPLTAAGVLSQGAFTALSAALPVLAFVEYERSETLAGILPAAWGGGAMLGSLLALRLVAGADPLRLGAAAWCVQAVALWPLMLVPAPALAVVALVASGLANGVRVPPLFAVSTARIPAALRAETMTVSSALVLTGGFLALLPAGPALEAAGVAGVLAGVAAVQTLAAALVLRLALASQERG